ncbi:MAG: hypothetical protein Aurels2KO_09830 [Aureliella sp.]
MAKYYLASGNVRTIISADDAEKAALWVVHKVMQQVLPVFADGTAEGNLESDGPLSITSDDEPAPKHQTPKQSAPKQLGSEILISEEGFGGDDAARMDTFELVCHWNQLMVALDRLQAIA